MIRSPVLAIALCGTILGTCSASAHAQEPTFPSKTVQMVVPFPPGAATDIIARTVAAKLGQLWGQSVVVENRAGATGAIGSSYVARSAPDGYTLLVGTSSSHVMGPHMVKQRPYDPIKDFKPITLLAWTPNILVVNPKVPVKTVGDLIALAKAEPSKLRYASSGNGSSIHLAGQMFSQMAGVDIQHIPYRGATPAVVDVIGGQVEMMFDTVASSLPHIKAGKLKPLGVTTTKRSSSLPDIPTMAEAGLPGYELAGWIGLLAPANTPDAIVKKLQADVAKIVNSKEVRDILSPQGIELAGTSSAEFAAVIKAEYPKYGKMLAEAGLRPE